MIWLALLRFAHILAFPTCVSFVFIYSDPPNLCKLLCYTRTCPAYAYERRALRPKKGRTEKKFAELLTNGEKIQTLTKYIQATKRFAQDEQPQSQNLQT